MTKAEAISHRNECRAMLHTLRWHEKLFGAYATTTGDSRRKLTKHLARYGWTVDDVSGDVLTCADCGDEGRLSASLCTRSLFGGVVLCDECEEGRRDAEIFARENAEVVGARGPQLNLACFPGLDIHHDAAGNLVVSGL